MSASGYPIKLVGELLVWSINWTFCTLQPIVTVNLHYISKLGHVFGFILVHVQNTLWIHCVKLLSFNISIWSTFVFNTASGDNMSGSPSFNKSDKCPFPHPSRVLAKHCHWNWISLSLNTPLKLSKPRSEKRTSKGNLSKCLPVFGSETIQLLA